jgi:hypothetical protein
MLTNDLSPKASDSSSSSVNSAAKLLLEHARIKATLRALGCQWGMFSFNVRVIVRRGQAYSPLLTETIRGQPRVLLPAGKSSRPWP